MTEEKVLFQSPANEETVLEKRERMERFGWILQDSSYDRDRNVTRFLYTRDLSLPENQWKKDSKEDAEDALLAKKFAENNIAYCEYRKKRNEEAAFAHGDYSNYDSLYRSVRGACLSVPRGYSCLRQVRNSRGARAFQTDIHIRFPGRKNAVRKNKFYLFRIS